MKSTLRIVEQHADLLKILGNPRRLTILTSIYDQERSVGEIAAMVGLEPQIVSQNLRLLKDKGAIVSRKAGKYVYYRCVNSKLCQGATLIREALEEEMAKHMDRHEDSWQRTKEE